jgi:hypothetical protein
MRRIPCLAVLALLAGMPAIAQQAEPVEAQPTLSVPAESGWRYTVAPYVFATGFSGRVNTFGAGPTADVDQGFGDLVDDLRFAAMIAGAAQNGRWGVSGDLQYYNLAPSFDTPGPLFDGGKLTAKQLIVSLTGEYVLSEGDRGALIGMAGARYWSVDTTLDFDGAGARGLSVDGSDSWLDPVIGLRGRYDLSDRWFVTGWAQAGGFGAGSDSMGDVFGAFGYRFSDRTSGVVGYRWLSVDRETDDFLYDITMDGIMAGVSFGF